MKCLTDAFLQTVVLISSLSTLQWKTALITVISPSYNQYQIDDFNKYFFFLLHIALCFLLPISHPIKITEDWFIDLFFFQILTANAETAVLYVGKKKPHTHLF